MPPHAYLVGGMQLFTSLYPLNFMKRHVIVACPCFSYAKACSSTRIGKPVLMMDVKVSKDKHISTWVNEEKLIHVR